MGKGRPKRSDASEVIELILVDLFECRALQLRQTTPLGRDGRVEPLFDHGVDFIF